MKKILFVFIGMLYLSGCAGLGLKTVCEGTHLQRPSFFAQGEYLAAFTVTLHANGQEMQALLQVKKTDVNSYQAVLFATAGGYQLMRAGVSEKGVDFAYLMPAADMALVREKAASFLTLLLFPPQTYKTCREKDGQRTVTYGTDPAVHYVYLPGQDYPRSLTYRKKFGTARMNFAQYTPALPYSVPQYIYYTDGSVEADLVLLAHKK